MEEDKIIIDVDLKVEDAANFQKVFFFSKVSPVSLIIINSGLLLMAILSIIVQPPFGYTPALAVMFLLIPACFLYFVTFGFKKAAASNFKTNKLVQKTQRYEIGTEDIKISSESGSSIIKWHELYKAMEIKDGFLLFISKQQAYYIPKRYFGENSGLIDMMRKYISFAPVPREGNKFFSKVAHFGCLIYIVIFFIILLIVTLISTGS